MAKLTNMLPALGKGIRGLFAKMKGRINLPPTITNDMGLKDIINKGNEAYRNHIIHQKRSIGNLMLLARSDDDVHLIENVVAAAEEGGNNDILLYLLWIGVACYTLALAFGPHDDHEEAGRALIREYLDTHGIHMAIPLALNVRLFLQVLGLEEYADDFCPLAAIVPQIIHLRDSGLLGTLDIFEKEQLLLLSGAASYLKSRLEQFLTRDLIPAP